MTEFELIPHPDFPTTVINAITVRVDRVSRSALGIAFRASGDLTNVLVPDEAAPGFEDGLWRHSCFEAFLGPRGDRAYTEFNFSPSGRYAAYEFNDHREGMRPTNDPTIERIGMSRGGKWLELSWFIHSSALEKHDDWQLGLSAVVEARDHTKSYWALAHPPGKPDFHNRDCFIASLPAPDVP